MPRQPKMITLKGPWRGIEERVNLQTEQHASVAINCDFSRGNIEARKGFRVIAETTAVVDFQLHLVKKNGKPRYIIGAGPRINVADEIRFHIWQLDGTLVASTTISEPHSLDWRCSFVDAIIPVKDFTTGLRTDPHRVTLVVTPYNTYIYDVDQDPAVLKKATVTQTIRFEKASIGYWENLPRGPIAVAHKGRVAYAGFTNETGHFQLTSTIEEDEDLSDSSILNQLTRSSYTMGPQWFALSDEFDPMGVKASYIVRVGDREVITGMASFMEQLIIFTDESIYTLLGSGRNEAGKIDFALRRVSTGIGCVSHDSIVEVAGALYFMAHDGIYAMQNMGPEGGVTKLSKPIDSLWSGNHTSTHWPNEINDVLKELGWPFEAEAGRLYRSKGLHVQSLNQIWWSVPVRGQDDGYTTLVFDYAHIAWSFHQQTRAGARETAMLSGLNYKHGSGERIVTNDDTGRLFEYGSPIDPSGGITFIYSSGRIFREQDSVITLRPIRLKMLSKGKTPATNPPRWFLEGEEAHRDAQVGGVTTLSADRQAAAGDLPTHPDEDNTYFWNASTFNGTIYNAVDWFSNKIEPDTVRSRSFRFGVVDDSGTQDRPPFTVINTITMEVKGEDPR